MKQLAGLLALCITAAGVGCSGGSSNSQPEVSTVDRPWVLESEFGTDRSLHARPDQIIVLDLEIEQPGEDPIRDNTVRLLIEKERHISYCLQADEPYLVNLWLERNGSSGKVLTNRAGGLCESVSLPPGHYTLHLFHDSRRIANGDRLAFLQPAPKLGASQDCDAASQSQSPCDSPVGSNLPQYDFTAFRSFGKYASMATPAPEMPVAAIADAVGPEEVWRIIPVTDSKFGFTSGTGAEMEICENGDGALFTGAGAALCDSGKGGALQATFRAREVSGFNFSLQMIVTTSGSVYGAPVNTNTSSGQLYGGGSTYASYNGDYHGFDCTSTCDDTTLPLSSGSIALYAQCNYQGSAIVFRADSPNLEIYNAAGAAGLAIGSDQARSVRVAPDTVAMLYQGDQFSGSSLTVGANIPCLDATALGNDTLSSFSIIDQSPLEYIISSNGCRNCILTGTDFAGQDFGGLDFSGTSLAGANLDNTDFTKANLSGVLFYGADTVLTGTEFSGANLECADFSLANITASQFSANVLTEDFSCYLDLSGATLDFSTFPPASWRFMNLTGATIQNLAGQVLSSSTNPLDLSGGILSGVDLSGMLLDSANFGCAGETCTSLQGTQFTGASLTGANMKQASLQGADLTSANLYGAVLQSADLGALPEGAPATLTGAYLRDVDLSKANLTGVIANYANFYSGVSGTATANNATMTGSKWNNAYLANADFGNAVLQSTEWTQAVLVGANFESADLSKNTTAGEITDFTGAYLQGAVFLNATVTDADFTSTYWDAVTTNDFYIQLQRGNLEFTGYWNDPDTPECVYVSYPNSNNEAADTPLTSASNTCPDGNLGPCDAVWGNPKTPIDQATPASSYSALPGSCTTSDSMWIY